MFCYEGLGYPYAAAASGESRTATAAAAVPKQLRFEPFIVLQRPPAQLGKLRVAALEVAHRESLVGAAPAGLWPLGVDVQEVAVARHNPVGGRGSGQT